MLRDVELPQHQKVSRTIPVNEQPPVKRLRLSEKQTPVDHRASWLEIFTKVDKMLPRVGRRPITDPLVLQQIDRMIPDKQVKQVLACRGTSRSLGPPSSLSISEAPFRKGVYLERKDENVTIDVDWDNWEIMSQRQLLRPTPACRINITVFAANPIAGRSDSAESIENQDQRPTKESMPQESPPTDVSG